jgi:hypothetical protein
MQTRIRRTAVRQAAFWTISMLLIQVVAGSERTYAPLSEYSMPQPSEIALARSAAPNSISTHATIEVLTPKGYETVIKGDNDFVCMVLRSWSAAPDPVDTLYSKIRAPICFDPVAARTVVPMEELKAQLGLAGKSPDEIAHEVAVQYGLGKLPKMESVAFAYMWSASQQLSSQAGPWHPHMMIYSPYYENRFLGNNPVGNHNAPFVVAEKTPYCIVMVVVDDKLAIKTAKNTRPDS